MHCNTKLSKNNSGKNASHTQKSAIHGFPKNERRLPAEFLLLVGYSNNEVVKYLFNTDIKLLIGREVKFRHIDIVLIISIYNLNGNIYFQTSNKHVIRTKII